MQDSRLLIEKEVKALNDMLTTCERVKDMIDSKGWQEICLPLLEKMIIDVVGGKTSNGKWHGGLLDKARKDEKREFYIGYKQALIDLHTRIYAYEKNIQVIKDKREAAIKRQDYAYTVPMQDTRYGREAKDAI